MNKKNLLVYALIALLVIIIVVAAVLFIVVLSQNAHLQQAENVRIAEYKAAEALLSEGKYDEAITAFAELGSYRDSAQRVLEVMEAKENASKQAVYDNALAAIEAGKGGEAKALLEQLDGGFKDVQDMLGRFEYKAIGVAMNYVGFDVDPSRITYRYAADGTVESTTYYYSEGDAATAVTDTLVHTYENGRLVCKASDLQSFTYTYDDAGNLTQVAYEKKSDAITFEDFSFEYLLGEFAWGNGDSIGYTYDSQGNRLTSQCQLSNGLQGAFKETYTLDADGKVTTMKRAYADGTETYQYHYQGTLLRSVELVEDSKEEQKEAHGYTYHYDDQGRLVSIVSNLGLGIEYKFLHDWVYMG